MVNGLFICKTNRFTVVILVFWFKFP